MISKEQIEQYNEEGYTIVEDVFDKDELNPILNEFDEIVDDFAEKAFQAGKIQNKHDDKDVFKSCLLYTSPSPRDLSTSRMPSSA